MKKKSVLLILVILFIGYGIFRWHLSGEQDAAFVGDGSPNSPLVLVTLPDQFSDDAVTGMGIFESNCASCHGDNAAGRDGLAPPLVHKIYEPSHHGDESFRRAVTSGVRGHHWRFGDMPPVEGLTRSDVSTIITYVRELQRANGID